MRQTETIPTEPVTGPRPDAAAPSDAHDTAKIPNRWRGLEGQVRGVQRMTGGNRYRTDVLSRLSAVIAGARAIGLLAPADCIRGCVVNGDPEHRDATLAKPTAANERFTRTVG